MQITRRLEFDAGHRIPDHQSQCRHLHGHRYVIEVCLDGTVIESSGRPDNGMVMDFSEVKQLVARHVVEPWDHAFLCWREDRVMAEFLAGIPDHKTVLLDRVPTAENLAQTAFDILAPVFEHRYANQLQLQAVRLYETPNCWAEIRRR